MPYRFPRDREYNICVNIINCIYIHIGVIDGTTMSCFFLLVFLEPTRPRVEPNLTVNKRRSLVRLMVKSERKPDKNCIKPKKPKNQQTIISLEPGLNIKYKNFSFN